MSSYNPVVFIIVGVVIIVLLIAVVGVVYLVVAAKKGSEKSAQRMAEFLAPYGLNVLGGEEFRAAGSYKGGQLSVEEFKVLNQTGAWSFGTRISLSGFSPLPHIVVQKSTRGMLMQADTMSMTPVVTGHAGFDAHYRAFSGDTTGNQMCSDQGFCTQVLALARSPRVDGLAELVAANNTVSLTLIGWELSNELLQKAIWFVGTTAGIES